LPILENCGAREERSILAAGGDSFSPFQDGSGW